MALEKRVYSSNKQYRFTKILQASLLGFKNSYYLAKQLALRDLKAQYRQSLLGVFWAFAPLIINSLVWIFLQGSGTIKLSETNVPYPLFVIIGTTLWSLFGEALQLTTQSVKGNQSILTKVNFDKEALITLGCLKYGVNMLLKFSIIVVFMVFYQRIPTWDMVWFIPLLLVSVLFFISIGILLTPIGLLYNDVGRMIPIGMQFLMYITPVVYAFPKEGLMYEIMRWNPIAYLMQDLRQVLTGFPLEYGPFWIGFVLLSILLFLMALVVYRVSIPIITERMSA
ncbi:MAG: ABC transporter permease [Flavobacteriales bacterium]|nr:ABC transporter permease [Flavobacteriales bacterium]